MMFYTVLHEYEQYKYSTSQRLNISLLKKSICTKYFWNFNLHFLENFGYYVLCFGIAGKENM